MNNRRKLIVALGAGALAAPFASVAQQPPIKIPRIGVLGAGIPSTYASRYEAFRQGLRELGYVEGQTIAIEYRYADGRFERLPNLVADLIGLNVDVIVTTSAPETGVAKQATTSIPIVFVLHGDPVGTGHVASLAKPGGNITGLSNLLPELSAKRLELLKETFPRIARVAVLWNSGNPAKAPDWRETQRAARALGLTLQSREVRTLDDLSRAFVAMTKQRPDALMTLEDPVTLTSRISIVEYAAKERLPAIFGVHEFVDAGGLMVYGSNIPDSYRRAAAYVAKILKGAKPADLPVEQPTKFELIVNMKTAKALGIKFPNSILLRADKVND